MAAFYGLYVADQRLAAALDLIRFLGQPNFVRRAHITVRGPYPQKLSSDSESAWSGKHYQINFLGPGTFFVSEQRTVFIRCEIPGIEPIWSKPDYGNEITPHLTLYDGKDGLFSSRLLEILKGCSWQFGADTTELVFIKPKTEPSSLDLSDFEGHQALYDEILNRRVDYRTVRTMSPTQRLVYIDWVVNFLQREYALDDFSSDRL